MNKTQSATPSDLFSKVREQNQDFHQLSLLLLGSDELAAREHAMESLLGRDRDGLARLLARNSRSGLPRPFPRNRSGPKKQLFSCVQFVKH